MVDSYKIDIDGVLLSYDKDKDKNKTILMFLEEHNIEMKFQCKDGYCGSCKCRILSGITKEGDNSMGYTKDDEILPCASKPLSDIKIQRIL